MIDLQKEDIDEEEDELKKAFTKTVEGFIKLRLRSEIDDRSYGLVVECMKEIGEIMEEYCKVCDDELLDTIFWEIDNK